MAAQGAYKQLQPFQSGISRDLQFWAQDAGAKRREQIAKDELNFRKSTEDQRRKDRLYKENVKPLNSYDTKSQGLNEGIMRIISVAQEKTIPFMKTMADPNASEEEQIKARIGMQKINSLPDKLKLSTDYYTLQIDAHDKGVAAGKFWENPEVVAFKKNGFKGIEFGLDENLDPIVAMRDLDGDGVLDVQTFDNISAGRPQWKLDPKFNEDEYAQKMAKLIGESDITTETGFTSNQEKGIDKEKLATNTKALYYKEDGMPSEFAKNGLRKAGWPATEKNIQKLMDQFMLVTEGYTDRTEKADTDFSSQTQRMKENRAANEAGAGGSKTLSAITDAGSGKTYSNAEVLDSRMKDGKIVLELSVPKYKSITKTTYDKYEQELADAQDSGDEDKIKAAQAQLSMAQFTDGGWKVILPGQNERVTIAVKDNDKGWVSKQLGIDVENTKDGAPAQGTGIMSQAELDNILNDIQRKK